MFKELSKEEVAEKYAVWCLGKNIPNEYEAIKAFMKRFLNETGLKIIKKV